MSCVKVGPSEEETPAASELRGIKDLQSHTGDKMLDGLNKPSPAPSTSTITNSSSGWKCDDDVTAVACNTSAAPEDWPEGGLAETASCELSPNTTDGNDKLKSYFKMLTEPPPPSLTHRA